MLRIIFGHQTVAIGMKRYEAGESSEQLHDLYS